MLSKFPCTFDLILVFLLVSGIPGVHWLKLYSKWIMLFYMSFIKNALGRSFYIELYCIFLPEFSVKKPQLNIFAKYLFKGCWSSPVCTLNIELN